MVIYRPLRGELAESLEEEKEFETFDDVKQYIVESTRSFYKSLGFVSSPYEIDDIVINEADKTDDERCGWHDTMLVCVKRFGDEDYMKEYGIPQCIGMCATDYQRLIPFGCLDRLYFVSKEDEKYTLYDNHKILILEPEEKALSVAKMAWENYEQSLKSGE